MADELKVGDRVKSICHEGGTLLGFHTNREGQRWAWVEWDDMADCYGCQLHDLTRISPAVPQAKYRVGQKVALRGMRATVEAVNCETTFTYDIRWPPPGTDSRNCREDDLEAVPVCQTCGQERRDDR